MSMLQSSIGWREVSDRFFCRIFAASLGGTTVDTLRPTCGLDLPTAVISRLRSLHLKAAILLYKDYLADHPEGGLQHLAYWVDEVDDALASIEAKGCRHKVWQRYGEAPDYKAHAYIDIEDQPGVMIQLMARSDFYDMFFGLMKQAADEWDGVTDPVRMLDISGGVPKAVPYERRT